MWTSSTFTNNYLYFSNVKFQLRRIRYCQSGVFEGLDVEFAYCIKFACIKMDDCKKMILVDR